MSLARLCLNATNRIVRPLDELAAASAAGTPAPVMVAGLPRSGTTLVYELMVQAFEVGFLTPLYSYTYGLPNLSTRIVARKIRDPYARYDSTYGRIPGRYAPAENAVFWNRWFAANKLLGHHVPNSCISDHEIREAEGLIASMSAITQRPYVFKNVYMTLSVPAFLRLLPKSKVIVVTRDMEAIIASVYNRRKSLSKWWSIRPPFVDSVENKSNLEQTAYQCIRSRQLLEHSLTTVPSERILVVDYSSVCVNPRHFIDTVAQWTGAGLARRDDSQPIPETFTRSAGPGLPVEDTVRLGKYAEPLEASGPQYLSRIESYIAEHATNIRA